MSFWYILTLWAKFGAEPTHKAITFPKNTFAAMQSFFWAFLTAKTIIWVGLKGMIEIESWFWKPENHTLKIWLAKEIRLRPVSCLIPLVQSPQWGLCERMSLSGGITPWFTGALQNVISRILSKRQKVILASSLYLYLAHLHTEPSGTSVLLWEMSTKILHVTWMQVWKTLLQRDTMHYTIVPNCPRHPLIHQSGHFFLVFNAVHLVNELNHHCRTE